MTTTLEQLQEKARDIWSRSEAAKRVHAVESMARVHGAAEYKGKIIPELIDEIVAEAYRAGYKDGQSSLDQALHEATSKLQ